MSTVRQERLENGIVLLVLDRPERHNAMSLELLDDLVAVLDVIADDESCLAVVLTGAGRSFCSGLDLSNSPPDTSVGRPQGGMRVQRKFAAVIPRLRALPQPVVAAVNGLALGGGMMLAAGCDVRVAAESALFSVRFIRMGLSSGEMSTSWLLPRLIGASRAFELMLTGRDVDAAEAKAIGLVSQVAADDDVVAQAVALAERIAANAPFGVQMTKEMMWSSLEIPSMYNALDLENRGQVLATMTEDFEEALLAFAEKRAPKFTNR